MTDQLSMHAMKYHLLVWKVTGLWSLPGDPIWYRVYSWLIYIIFYFLYPLCIALQSIFTNNFGELIDILLILPTACAGVKGYFVILKRHQLRKLFVLIDQMDVMVREPNHRQTVQRQVDGSIMLVKALSCIYYSTVVSSFMVAFLAEDRRFMWQSYYPFDYQHNLGIYYFFLLFQLVASFLVSFIYSSIDIYGSALYKVLGAHIDVLGDKLDRLGKSSGDDGFGKHRTAVEVKEYSTYLNDILSIHFMFQFGTSGLVFCGSEFKISTLDPVADFTDFVFIFMYIVSMTYQIFIPCYFGSIVKAKSEALPHHLFESNWMNGGPALRSAVKIIGERVMRPITPYAGGLFAVGLPTFVSIMKSAYSLMAFLKNVESQQ